jgi:hypothetical protein
MSVARLHALTMNEDDARATVRLLHSLLASAPFLCGSRFLLNEVLHPFFQSSCVSLYNYVIET